MMTLWWLPMYLYKVSQTNMTLRWLWNDSEMTFNMTLMTREMTYRWLCSIKVRTFWEGQNFWKNLPLKILRYSVTSNFKRNIFLNFVAVSEYPNFTLFKNENMIWILVTFLKLPLVNLLHQLYELVWHHVKSIFHVQVPWWAFSFPCL